MKKSRRPLLAHAVFTAALATGLPVILGTAHAASDDTRPIRLLVGFPAGGGTDLIARLLADEMGRELKQSVIVENRPGGGGVIAAQAVKQAPADGKTLMVTNDHTVAILPHTLKTARLDTQRDFAPIAMVGRSVFGLAVNAKENVRDLKSIPAWKASTKASAINIGVPSPASIPEFAVSVIGAALKVETTSVPYRGASPMLSDLAGGQVPFGITSTAELRPFLETKQVHLLAVAGTRRHPDYPQVPTFSELGIPQLTESNLTGVYARAGTPPELISAYEAAVRKATASESFVRRAADAGITIAYGDHQALAKAVQRITTNWEPVLKEFK